MAENGKSLPEQVEHRNSPNPYGEKDKDQQTLTEISSPAGHGRAAAVNLIENPLKHHDKARILADVERFCQEKGLSDHLTLFGHGALVARDPQQWYMVDDLTQEERDALEYERDHKWAGSRMLWYSIMVCAIGAAVQGWDQTGSNAANLSFPQEFGLSAVYGEAGGERDEWIIGLINSIIYLTAGLIGCWLSDPVNNLVGRRGEVFISAAILLATPIWSGFSKSWQELFASRFVMGVGIGMKNSTIPIFSSEMAPARVRGALVMFWQLWVTFGIFLGFAANLVVKDAGDITWRLQIGSAFIPCVPLLLGIYFCPESPRWLMKKGRYPKAFRSMLKLRKHPIIAARDLYYSHVLYEEEKRMAKGSNYFSRLLDLFRVPRIRRAFYGAGTVMIAQQMCGINIISFYSSTVFVRGGFTELQALYASLGFGALNFVFTIPALFTIDTWGRRTILLSTFPFMFLSLLGAGLCFLVPETQPQLRVGLVALFIYLFTCFYSCGEGPVAFQYSAEVFPTIQREQGMALAVSINNVFAGVLGLTFPPLQRALTTLGAFCFYAGLNVVAFFMIWCLVPETKQASHHLERGVLTLEELDHVFSIPTHEFVKYETNVWLPWALKRYVARRKDTPRPAPLLAKADGVGVDAAVGGRKRSSLTDSADRA